MAKKKIECNAKFKKTEKENFNEHLQQTQMHRFVF